MTKSRKPNPKLDDKRTIENLKRDNRSLEEQLRKAIAERDLLAKTTRETWATTVLVTEIFR